LLRPIAQARVLRGARPRGSERARQGVGGILATRAEHGNRRALGVALEKDLLARREARQPERVERRRCAAGDRRKAKKMGGGRVHFAGYAREDVPQLVHELRLERERRAGFRAVSALELAVECAEVGRQRHGRARQLVEEPRQLGAHGPQVGGREPPALLQLLVQERLARRSRGDGPRGRNGGGPPLERRDAGIEQRRHARGAAQRAGDIPRGVQVRDEDYRMSEIGDARFFPRRRWRPPPRRGTRPAAG
jgi:hypothetical protein